MIRLSFLRKIFSCFFDFFFTNLALTFLLDSANRHSIYVKLRSTEIG